jgi:hypothetical protein
MGNPYGESTFCLAIADLSHCPSATICSYRLANSLPYKQARKRLLLRCMVCKTAFFWVVTTCILIEWYSTNISGARFAYIFGVRVLSNECVCGATYRSATEKNHFPQTCLWRHQFKRTTSARLRGEPMLPSSAPGCPLLCYSTRN